MSLCADLSRLKQRAQDLALGSPPPCTRCKGGGWMGTRPCPRCAGIGYLDQDRIEALGALVEELIETVAGLAAKAG